MRVARRIAFWFACVLFFFPLQALIAALETFARFYAGTFLRGRR